MSRLHTLLILNDIFPSQLNNRVLVVLVSTGRCLCTADSIDVLGLNRVEHLFNIDRNFKLLRLELKNNEFLYKSDHLRFVPSLLLLDPCNQI